MKTNKFLIAVPLTVLAMLTMLVGSVGAEGGLPISDNGVVPIYVAGNPSCTDLGYAYGAKWNYPEDSTGGTYPLGTGLVTWSTDGVYVDWSSTFGVDAVIVKGGPNANSYVYDPPAESYGDGGLASPINSSTGRPYGLSHVEFCYDYEVQVIKNANPTFTRTYTWTIDKSVTPETWDLFKGDSGTSKYTISLVKTVTDSNWAVSGKIWIYNPDPTYTATITSVVDSVGGVPASVSCPAWTVAPGATLECTYSASLPNGDTRINTATVTTTGKVGGGSGTANVVFGSPTTVVGYASVNVDDTNGGSWLFNDSGSVSYDKTFACNADKGKKDNTATIRETGQYDDASVTVNCYELAVTKDASTSFKRTYHWTIDKWGDQTALTLAVGEQFLVNYKVKVDATYTDSDWVVNGKIYVNNPAPMAATINNVDDYLDLGAQEIAANVDCGVTFPYELGSGGKLTCDYNANAGGAWNGTNYATATLQNYAYDYELKAAKFGTTNFNGSAVVDFATATITHVDKCIDVTDTYAGSLGTVCYPDVPKTFNYSRWIGPYAVCGDYTVENTASFVTNTTGTTGSDSWTVNINVPCGGCTLTPGYWKTHSKYGPAPYDATWALLGEDTPFFLSGKTYYQVLWTPPEGNAYYILANAYIAAKLNILNGATSTPEVDAAIAWAEDFFDGRLPWMPMLKKTRNEAISYAYLLDQYNNGYIGPGHCSE
jgi:hypothetical protein